MGVLQLEILKKQTEFLETFSKILKFMEKIILNVLDMVVMDIFKRFYCPTDQPFIVQNVRSSKTLFLFGESQLIPWYPILQGNPKV